MRLTKSLTLTLVLIGGYSINVNAQLYSSGINVISGSKVGIGVSNPKSTIQLKDFSGPAIGGGITYVPQIRLESTNSTMNPITTNYWDFRMDLSSNLTFWHHNTQNNNPSEALRLGYNNVKVFERFKVGDYGEYGTGLTPDNSQGYVFSLGLKELGSGAWQGKGAVMFSTSSGDFQLMTNHSSSVVNGASQMTNNLRLSANTDGVRVYGALTLNTANAYGYDMAINGDAIFNKVVVKSYGSWPDFVFLENYNLRSLNEVKVYISQNGHLPDVPSAEEVNEEGVDVYEVNKILLQKIEELTLYMIDLQEQVNNLKNEK